MTPLPYSGGVRRLRPDDDPEGMAGTLARILERGPAPADDLEWPEPACDICNDRGYVHHRLPGGALDYDAPLELCECRRKAWEASLPDRLARHWELHSGVPAHFRHLRLDTHPNLIGDNNPGMRAQLWATDCSRASWYFWGTFGTGKTGIAVGYGWRYLNETGGNVLFRTLPKLLSELRATYNRPARNDEDSPQQETEADVMHRYQSCGLLILDDLGAEQVNGSGWVEDRLYQIIGERHDEDRPTVFTSNLSLSELRQRIGERIIWRIVESCGELGIVEVQGRNLRQTW